MGRIDMKEFNLVEYLANPDRQIVTRSGRAAKILYTNRNDERSIIALVTTQDGKEQVHCYYPDGKYYKACDDYRDLMFVPIEKEGWINIYNNNGRDIYCRTSVFSSENEARLVGEAYVPSYVATCKIEWEE